MNYAYIYLPEQMADWEPALVAAELNTGRFFKAKGQKIPIKTFGLTRAPITTMGGWKITPALTIEEVESSKAALLLLPGGSDWQNPKHNAALKKAAEFLKADVLVAVQHPATLIPLRQQLHRK